MQVRRLGRYSEVMWALTLEEFWKLPEPKYGSTLELIAGVLYLFGLEHFLFQTFAENSGSEALYPTGSFLRFCEDY